MDFVNRILYLFACMATIAAFFFLTPLYTLLKVLLHISRTFSKEDVAGKVVLIVGASSGIGEHLAYEYARRGACLVLAARREKSLRQVAETAESLGSPEAIAVPADVSNIDDCKRLINETINHFGQLNHLVNCAGVTPMCMLEDITDVTSITPVMDINFWGYVYMTYLSMPHLRSSKGKIVVIASSASWMPAPRMSLYNSSKAAVVSFYESLRMELGSQVGITIVTPGLTESEMTQGKVMNKDGKMVVDQDLRDAEMSIVPIEMAATSAIAIVESACRGDTWLNHEPGVSPMDAPAKKLLDVPGLRRISQPSSVWSSEINE